MSSSSGNYHRRSRNKSSSSGGGNHKKPRSSDPGGPEGVLVYVAPKSIAVEQKDAFREIEANACSDEDCSICLESLRNGEKVVSLKVCKHQFHYDCVQDVLSRSYKCPICRKPACKAQGTMPSAMMEYNTSYQHSIEPYGPGSIRIRYTIPSGIQMDYHENPGRRHGSAVRDAYLPDNEDGRKILKRLKFAFNSGLTFTVGTSLTTGVRNAVTWTSIHHKTSITKGPHGYPDPGYFANVNEELDALDVPPAENCP